MSLNTEEVVVSLVPSLRLLPRTMDDESAEIELVRFITTKNSNSSVATDMRCIQLEQNLNKTHQISQRMICTWTDSMFTHVQDGCH